MNERGLVVNKLAGRAAAWLLTLQLMIFNAFTAAAQDKGLKVDVDVNKNNGGGAWYMQWWIWVIIILLFIIVIVAITNRGKKS